MTTAPAKATLQRDEIAPQRARQRHAERFLAALDARGMGAHLACLLGGDARSCHVVDAKFEPGVRAIVLYEHGDLLIRGDVLETEQPAAGRPILGPGVSVSVFPDDDELPTLRRLVDPAAVGAALAEVAPAPRGSRRRWARRCHVSLLRYRPGKRVTILATAGQDQPRYVVKGYHDAVKARAVAEETAALQLEAGVQGTLRLAPVVAFVPELQAVVSRAITGTPLDAIAASPWRVGVDGHRSLGLAGAALAELHEASHLARRERVVEQELRRFVTRASGVGTVDSSLGDALVTLAERLTATLGALPPPVYGTVHGDCKPSQFVTTGDQAYLLDLDHVGAADQATDLGTFLATIRQRAIRRRLSDHAANEVQTAEITEAFLTGYLDRRTTIGPTLERIRWHEAVALERKALRAFARAPRSPLPAALVAAAHTCLDTLTLEDP